MKNETETQRTELSFNVDAALLVELGERLVARRSVALAELIKNAYDADATTVTVSFKNMCCANGEIVVTDDGSGMTLSSMGHGWMRVATTDAVSNAKSKRFGRPRTGAKGIGRFACGRLASRLSLQSTASVKSGCERISAEFNWSAFKAGTNLSDLKTAIAHKLVEDELVTGTQLRLTELVDSWEESDISELRVELGDLMNPYDHQGYVHRSPKYEPDPGFKLSIEAPEFPEQEGELHERFWEAAWAVLKGTVKAQGQPEYELEIRDSGNTEHFTPSGLTLPNLVGAEFTVRMMLYAGGRFKESGYSLMAARRLGRARGGVRVYLDGFQVFSYGSPGDDWLDLDQERGRRQVSTPSMLMEEARGLTRPMLSLPGNMQLFGAVSISSDKNLELIVSISRERLVENDSFDQLKRFVRGGIDWMTVCYARESTKAAEDTSDSSKPTTSSVELLQTALNRVRREEKIPPSIRREVAASISHVIEVIELEKSSQLTELSMLRILASAGTTVLIFDHTLRAMAGQLIDITDRLRMAADYLPSARHVTFEETLGDLRTWSSMANSQGSLVGLLLGPEARTRARSLAVHPLVQKLRRGFNGYTTRFGISLENAVPRGVRTPPLHEAELYAVLINLLTNSFKAVRGVNNRGVSVEASRTPTEFMMRVNDTGIGVPRDNRQDVFQPFFTTSSPDPVLGVGTGLGLTIVRDLVTSWGGDVHFVDAADPWRTSIQVVLPTEK